MRLLLEALFTDDCALMAHNEHHLQVVVDKFSEAANKFGLRISLSKTEAFFQTAPATSPQQPCITIDGTQLKNVESFKYLGSTISSDRTLDREITARIQKANYAFGRLRTKVLQHKSIYLSTKLKVYTARVLPSLLYGCETWTVYRRHLQKLEQFHARSLRSIPVDNDVKQKDMPAPPLFSIYFAVMFSLFPSRLWHWGKHSL